MAFEVKGEDVLFTTRTPYMRHWSGRGKLTPGKWHDFAVHVLWSRDPKKGFVEVWFDGEKVVPLTNTATLRDETIAFFQIGLFRETSDVPETIIIDNVLEATTLQDVVPPRADVRLGLSATDWQGFQRTVQPFLARYCSDCHSDKPRGDVRLDRFDEKSLAKRSPTLEKVLNVLGKHAMPPRKRAQPSDGELKPVLAWLEAHVERLEQKTARSDRVLIRRLNRAEYNNTVRDLLGVDFQPAGDFPQDVAGHGFDNIAGTLSVSPVLMEKYLTAAEKVARAAVFGVAPMKLERVVHEPWFAANAFSRNNEVKFDYDETGMSLPSAFHVVQGFADDGEYTFRGILRGVRPAGSDPVELGFWIDGKLVHTSKIAVPPQSGPGRNAGELNGLWAEFRTPVKAGEHWLSVTILRMYEGLPAATRVQNLQPPRQELQTKGGSMPSLSCTCTSSDLTSRR